jgi:hypothetical protein
VELEALAALRERAQLIAEDHLVGLARGVQQHRVADLVGTVEVAQHGDDRRDAAPRGDEQHLLGDLLREYEVALNTAE